MELVRDNDISIKSKKSFKWSLIAEIFAKIATPLSTMVLARLLAPEIFGITASITMVVSFCEAISESGFAKYIIQRDFESQHEYKKYLSVASFSAFFFSLVLFALIFIFNRQISSFIGNSGYEKVLIISSLQIPIVSINAIFSSNLKRHFKFKKLFVARVIFSLTPFVITIPLAFLKMSYWSLVIGTISSQLLQMPIILFYSRKEIKIYFSFKYLGRMLKASFAMILESIIIWMCSWVTTFVATQFFDNNIVGIVKVAESTVNNVFSIFTTAFTSTLFVTLSRLKNNESEYQTAFYSLQSSAFIMLIPMSIGGYFYANTITSIFLGNSWEQATNVIAILFLSRSLVICFNHFVSEVFRTKGHFYSSIIYQLAILIIDIALKLTIGRISFENFVWTSVLTNLIVTIMAILVLLVKYKFSFIKQLKSLVPAVLCSLFMIPFFLLKLHTTYSTKSAIAQIAICASVYFCVCYIFFKKSFANTISYLGLNNLRFISKM